MQMNPYLSFSGDCESAFRFYEAMSRAERSEESSVTPGHPWRRMLLPTGRTR